MLPPPPPSLQQSLLNDRQVPSITNHLKINGTELSSFPTNLLVDEQNQINEVELSSDDESAFLSDEQVETTISSNIPPLTNETTETSLSSPSTFETHATSSNAPLDSDRMASTTDNHQEDSIESQSTDTTPRRISIDDDEVARMDAEQIAETIPTDITNVSLTNDNAIFTVDDFNLGTEQQKMLTSHQRDHHLSENQGFVKTNKTERQNSRLRLNHRSTSVNFRKTVNSILSNLKTAK